MSSRLPDYFCPWSGFWTTYPSSWTDGDVDDDDDDGDGGGGGCGWTRSAPRSSCCTGLSVRTLVFGGSHCLVETRQTSQRSRTPPPPATAGLVKARFCNKNTLRLLSWNLLNFNKRNIFQKVEYFTKLFTDVHIIRITSIKVCSQ